MLTAPSSPRGTVRAQHVVVKGSARCKKTLHTRNAPVDKGSRRALRTHRGRRSRAGRPHTLRGAGRELKDGGQTMLTPDMSLMAPAAALGAIATERAEPVADPAVADDVLQIASAGPRERFIPVTRFALVDRLAQDAAWASGEAREVRRFFRYLDHWRHQQYGAEMLELEQAYEPFNPDTDLLLTRTFSGEERHRLLQLFMHGAERILEQAHYERIDPHDVQVILTRESHYGLDLHVDFGAFEECLVYYRGASTRRDARRSLKKFLRKEEFDVPIFQRLFLLFKLKPFETRVREVMETERVDRKEAERIVRRLRALLPAQVKEENVYLKLFKNIPRTDVEMVFPNTTVRFRLKDKIKLGVTAGGGLGMGVVGAAGKLALAASNPIAAAGALLGLGTIAFRQAMNFVNQKQRYMVVMAQNLYFHSMADNRGVMIKLADRAAEEDVKEDMLLYTVLAKEPALRSDLPAIDAAVEQYLHRTFGVHVDFDLEDALRRLLADGIVEEDAEGVLRTLPPRDAARHIDEKWDAFLDQLPDALSGEGCEFAGNP